MTATGSPERVRRRLEDMRGQRRGRLRRTESGLQTTLAWKIARRKRVECWLRAQQLATPDASPSVQRQSLHAPRGGVEFHQPE